jgi:hypothetical protein
MDDTRSFPNEYLRLVIHLFSARFGSYDPLATILSNTYSGDSTKLDGSYWAAQLTTNRSSWETRSISNPCEYLRGLYGDTELGSDIEMSQKTEENKLIESTQDIIALPDSVGSVADVDLTDTTVFDDQFIWSGEDLVNSFQDASFYENDWECLLDTFDFNPADRDPCNDLVPNLPSEADMHPADQSFKPYECKSLSPEDLFNPRWVRAHGIAQQGWCGLCNPGRWLLLGDSSYIDDKAFNHGINSITGRHFDEPKSTRQSSCDTWEAFCGTCLQWVSLYWDKDNSYFWFEHANKVFFVSLLGLWKTNSRKVPHKFFNSVIVHLWIERARY